MPLTSAYLNDIGGVRHEWIPIVTAQMNQIGGKWSMRTERDKVIKPRRYASYSSCGRHNDFVGIAMDI